MKGHSIVVWKERVEDLGKLNEEQYATLMNVVDKVRNALIKSLSVEKVYLVYADEIKHVHWHLVPRYNEEGFTLLTHTPSELTDVSFVEVLRNNL